MCFNEYVSFGSLIVGTIFNIILYNKFKSKRTLCIIIMWEWVLLMQFFEGLIWISNNNKNDNMNKICTFCAYLSNILQPIITYLCIMLLTSQPTYSMVFSTIIICVYVAYMIYKYFDHVKDNVNHTNNRDNCNHLVYDWWQYDSGLVYIICLLLIILLAAPHSTFLFQFAIISITLLIASVTRLNCGTASTWCFLAASAPLLTLLYHTYIQTN